MTKTDELLSILRTGKRSLPYLITRMKGTESSVRSLLNDLKKAGHTIVVENGFYSATARAAEKNRTY